MKVNLRAFVVALVIGAMLLVNVPMGVQAQGVGVYSVSGTVSVQEIYGEASKPLAGAEVFLQLQGSDDVASVVTDDAGGFRFENLDEGTYNLTASHECCTHGFHQVTVSGTDFEADGIKMVLRPQNPPESQDKVNLHGRVHNQATDAAVPLARITLSNSFEDSDGSSSFGGYQYFEVISDKDGMYSIDINAGRVDIWVDKDGFDYTSGFFVVEKDTELDIPMRDSKKASAVLEGTVKSVDGTALADVYISVSRDYRCDGDVCYAEAQPAPASSRPDSAPYYQGDGEFRFQPRNNDYASTQSDKNGAWRVSVNPGNLRVYAYRDGFLPLDAAVSVAEGESKQVNLVMEPIPPDSVTVVGRVVDARNGQGIAFAQVSLENQRWGHYNWTQTDDDGKFEMRTKPGYTIVVASAWRDYWVPCDYADDKGRGEPEPMMAEDEQSTSGSSGSGGTSSASSESIRSPAPYCEPQEREHSYFTRTVTFLANQDDTKRLTFELARFPEPDATFVGWVVNASSGKGVPDAMVSFNNERTRDWGQVETDQDGSFKIKVHAGYYTVRTYAEGYFDQVINTEIDSGDAMRLALKVEPGEKRYGYCCYYGGYGYADGRAESAQAPTAAPGGSGDAQASAPAPPSSPTPQSPQADGSSSGQQVYFGEAGGLGPYEEGKELSSGGDGGPVPGPGALVVLLGLVASAAALARRRRA